MASVKKVNSFCFIRIFSEYIFTIQWCNLNIFTQNAIIFRWNYYFPWLNMFFLFKKCVYFLPISWFVVWLKFEFTFDCVQDQTMTLDVKAQQLPKTKPNIAECYYAYRQKIHLAIFTHQRVNVNTKCCRYSWYKDKAAQEKHRMCLNAFEKSSALAKTQIHFILT